MDARGGFVGRALLLLATLLAASANAGDRIRVANEGGIRDAWTLPAGAKLAVPAYPAAFAASPAEACVAIGYLIHADGHTSDFALLKAWGAQEPGQRREAYWGEFAGAAASALAQWRFVPKPEIGSPRPVYTVATFVFASADARETRKRCIIPNLAMHLIELRQGGRARRRMTDNSLFERLDIDPALEARDRGGEQRRTQDAQPEPLPPPPPSPPSPPPPAFRASAR